MTPRLCSSCLRPLDQQTVDGGSRTCEACRATWRPDSGTGSVTFVTALPGRVAEGRSRIELSDAFRRRFTLEEFLGAGATSTVYSAHDHASDRPVAVKLIGRRDRSELVDLLDEARLLRQLSHENVLRVIDVGSTGSCAWIATDLAGGGTLEHLLQAQGRLMVAEAIRITLDVLSGLRAAHLTGIVHRDVKPGNVLLDRSGRALVSDFGIARQYGDDDPRDTEVGLFLGTPTYMAPEQLQREPAEVRSDLWAVGVMLYEMLEGRLPYAGATIDDLRAAQSKPVTLSGDLPDILTTIRRALSPIRTRWTMASEVAEALGTALRARGQPIRDWAGREYVPDVLRSLAGRPAIAFHDRAPGH